MTDPTSKRGQDSAASSVEQLKVTARGDESDGLDPTAAPPPKSISSPNSSQPSSPSFRISQPGGQASGAPPAFFVGRILGDRWEVKQRIGIGGMASVHEGMDMRLERPVAVKILHPHVAENPDSRERLGREARAIAQLKHENIIEVYDYSSDDTDCTWLVTELIDGASLRQILDRIERPMPEVAVMIVTEVVRALRAAHGNGIVHRDVKPDNILVGKGGRPKLSDFGIAQIVNEHRMTMTGNLVGSPSYMSPEQANGKRTDHRTDLFSAGILLYRMVTGTLPFRGQTAIETIRKVSLGEFTDPVELEAGCQGAVAGIIRRSLAQDLNERYQTADELLADLQTVLQDSGLAATWEELPKFFADPTGYQKALKPRLARELETRGQALLNNGEEGRAVDCFNRAMSLGEGTQRTMDIVRELSKRRGKGRVKRIVRDVSIAVAAVALVSVVLLVTDRLMSSDAAVPETHPILEAQPPPTQPIAVKEEPKPEPVIEPVAKVEEAPAKVEEPVATKRGGRRSRKERAESASSEREPERKSSIIAAGLPPAETAPEKVETPKTALYGTLQLGGNVWFDVYVDGQKLGRVPDQSKYPLVPGIHKLRAIKPDCEPVEQEFTIEPGETHRLKLKIECH